MPLRKGRAVTIAPNEFNALETIHGRWIDLQNREIWIHGIDMNNDSEYAGKEPGVEYMMATRVIKNLHFLRHKSPSKPVVVNLHTCGGMWEEGMAIYDTIMAMPYHVTVISYTHARSMSSIILQAADRRILMPNSYFMFHWGEYWFGSDAAQKAFSNVDFSRKVQNRTMLEIYVQKARNSRKFKGWSEARIRSYLKSQMDKKIDVFLTPEEAIEWGFADEVFSQWPS